MGRRGNNEGSITKRPDGTWMAQVTMPDGRRKTAYAKTRAAVQVKLKELREEADKASLLLPGTSYNTLKEFLDVWLATKEHSRSPGTVESYRYYIQHYCQELLNVVPTKITPAHIQQLYAKRFEDGLSSTTVWKIHLILRNALGAAVKQGVLLRNPCSLVEAPRKAHHQQQTWTIEEARAFIEAIQGDRYQALFILALSTGMRQGEVFGLRWSAVNLQQGWVQVRTNLQRVNHKLTLKNTKTQASTHTILLAPFTIAALAAHYERQQLERSAMGDKWNNQHDLVFCSTIGTPVLQRNIIRRHFEPAIQRAGIPAIRFHDMRHTAATLLLESGIHPKVVSEVLGHSSVKVTMDLYAHATPVMHQAATGVMQIILRGHAELPLSSSEPEIKLLTSPSDDVTCAAHRLVASSLYEALDVSIQRFIDADVQAGYIQADNARQVYQAVRNIANDHQTLGQADGLIH